MGKDSLHAENPIAADLDSRTSRVARLRQKRGRCVTTVTRTNLSVLPLIAGGFRDFASILLPNNTDARLLVFCYGLPVEHFAVQPTVGCSSIAETGRR
jgi:hypothetical protein